MSESSSLHSHTSYRQVALPILASLVGVLSMTFIAYLLDHGTIPLFKISKHSVLNLTFTMQMLVLPVSFVAVLFMYMYNRTSFKEFFRWSSGGKSEWTSIGPIVAILFTGGNILLMAGGVMSQNGSINDSFFALLPWVLLLAATNAWSEEIFSRFVIVAGLFGRVNPVSICWISALVFGLPHFFGTPSGVIGVIGSGALGWFLARSVIETKGLGWAWTIHFLQDVVIFGAGAMIIAGRSE